MTRPIADGIMVEAMRITRLTRSQITTKSRIKALAQTRQAIIYALHKKTTWSWLKLARYVGLTDHTTAIHAARKIEALIVKDPEMEAFVDSLLNAPEIDPYSPEYVPEAEKPKPPPPPKPAFVMPHLLAIPKPKPVFERVHYEGGRYMLLDERGDCEVARKSTKNMEQGSKALVKAIMEARAGA